MDDLRLVEHLSTLYHENQISKIIVVAIHAGDRLQEYGTIHLPDHMNRGSKAAAYSRFVLKELRPYLRYHFKISTIPAYTGFAGSSLGGLSAFDIAFHYPRIFGRIGVFSGSFWWRSKNLGQGYLETDRIIHRAVKNSMYKSGLRFWFEAGSEDEENDRNNSGIIDSIEDTLALIDELKTLGYKDDDIEYREVAGGKHDPETWSGVLPEFLIWAFGK